MKLGFLQMAGMAVAILCLSAQRAAADPNSVAETIANPYASAPSPRYSPAPALPRRLPPFDVREISCESDVPPQTLELPTTDLQQPDRLLPGEVGPEPTPPAPSALALPSWLLPATPADVIEDSGIKLATATEAVPRRSAALYAQAEKLAADAGSRGDLTDIIELCESGLQGQPSDELRRQLCRLAGWAYNLRGEHLIDEGDERAAFDDFARAINTDPGCWAAYQNRAITYATYGQNDDAFRDFATAIELNPDAADLYRNRAELHAQLGRWMASEDDLSRAIAITPTDGDLRALRGDIYQRQGKSDLAAAEFDAAVAQGSTTASALARRASLAARNGDYDRAIIDYDAALQSDPYHAATYRGVAWLLSTCPDARYRDPQKALEAASRAQRFGTANDPVVLDTVAAAHASAGKFDSAINLARQAASLSPPALRAEIEHRIDLYQARQPYRSAPSK